jgi:predicted TIM-barrel fold metal-dependent hydrolase
LRILADRIGVPEGRLADLACREVPARLADAYPNLYASIAATNNFVARSPRQFAEWVGKLMFWCGEDKIIYGSEAPIWHPKWALEAFSGTSRSRRTWWKATATRSSPNGQSERYSARTS